MKTLNDLLKNDWLIWSNEHRAFWMPNEHGYTTDINAAGRYSFARAIEICKNSNFYFDEIKELPVPTHELSQEILKSEL